MTVLPKQDWLGSAGGKALMTALDTASGRTRLVGGAVRDARLGLPVSDIDLATSFTPEEVIARLEAHGLKAVPTGLKHGTVTAVSHGLVAEVTTLRRDVATDGRHADIAYTDDWKEDAARRDFTINALNATLPEGEITDFFGGLDDLEARRVRFIGDPLTRIAEDHLRILRFFRFHARFARGAPDAEGLAACAARANDLMTLSRERIAAELLKTAALSDPADTFAAMVEHGIWRPVLPEIEEAGVAAMRRVIAREKHFGIAPDPLRRLAALLPADVAIAEDVAQRLRLSKTQRLHLVAAAARLAAVPTDPRALAFVHGSRIATDLLLLTEEDVAAPLAILSDWERPPLPISGRHIIARGLAPGPAVSAALQRFQTLWLAAGLPDDKAEIDRLMDQAITG
ncbi:CCA tRNA nucleotidyltransferase [Pacificimonas sp. WHA3]|uniref:CCA tRNA nucleotidyltransferase n=1 Tax=Pacificimonas pallii TaxID=2827236 RepID=A0ABS6SF94_9SPHN|nr:CCA tRNA nucleotidyltransferase [Pacificimonas pallii]MBV7257078.1 CCA tRNA nucleotidyltransferase [Pacificimonas pallii]